MKNKKSKYFCVIIALILGLLSYHNVKAETAGLGVDTSVVMLRFDPGKDLQFHFNVKNQTSFEQVVHLEEKDIAIGDDNSIDFANGDGLSSLVNFEENDFILSAGQSKPVHASLKVPKEQKASAEMMTMVSFVSKNDGTENNGPKINGSIGVYTLLSGADAQNATGKLDSLSYSSLVADSAEISVVYSNVGDVQFVPQGKISDYNFFTRERHENSFDSHFVFPGRRFNFVKKISNLNPFWLYELKVSFKDGNGQLIEQSGYVMGKFFPIVLLFSVIIFAYLGFVLRKVRKRNV